MDKQMPDEAIVCIDHLIMSFLHPSKESKDAAKRYGVQLTPRALSRYGMMGAVGQITEAVRGDEEKLAHLFPGLTQLKAALAVADLWRRREEGRKAVEPLLIDMDLLDLRRQQNEG